MHQASRKKSWLALLPASILFLGAGAFAAPRSQASTLPQTQQDNTRTNKGDASQDATTADQQKMNPTDRALTQKIRTEVMKDKSLSTYAHNVKIISQDGKVTLKGPVRTKEEKTTIGEKAAAVAGEGNVTNEIEIVPPKS
jgi:hyperosmotically inducible protein